MFNKLKRILIILFYVPLSSYNLIKWYLTRLCLIFLWKSRWGIAMFHAIWHKYRTTSMFTERVEYFGRVEAAKMLSYQEFVLFKTLLLKDQGFKRRWYLQPSSIIREYGYEDLNLKAHINLK